MLKKSLLLFFTLCGILLGNVINLPAQTLQIVPESAPAYDYSSYASHAGGYWGYTANPFVFNNQLYVQYQSVPSNGAYAGTVPLQLAVYNNNTLNLIANPDTLLNATATGYVFQSTPIVYNNNLCINYLDKNSINRLAVYNGSTLSLVPNPDASKYGYLGNPVVFNNKLYIQYTNPSGTYQLASYDGTTITLIPNPDASTYGYQGNPIVFNGELYLKYAVNNANGTWHLAQFNGTTWTVLANPDTSPYGYQGNPIIYNNKLYLQYTNASGVNQLMVYDGTNAPALIANPDNGTGYTGLPIVYNSNLYIQYKTAAGALQLGKYDGTSISLIPNPDATTYGYWNTPVVYNNTLCIFYLNVSGVHQLAVYTGGSSLKLIANPDASPNGYWDKPIVYGTNLYYQYNNAAGVLQLGFFDGTSMHLIPNPNSVSTSTVNYQGLPIVFNNLLYMQYNDVQYAQLANLVYISESALPVTFVNFNATLQNNEALLTWSTATEINNKGFEIQKSLDGQTFTAIGFVAGHGNSSQVNKYDYTDVKVLSGLNYYRLKQIDFDGNFVLSNIVYVTNNTNHLITFMPNPAKNFITISSPVIVKQIRLLSVSGQIMKVWQNVSPNAQLDLGTIASGTYLLEFINDQSLQTMKLVKSF